MKLPPQEALTKEEVEALLRQADRTTCAGLRDWCILRLMLWTGLRRAEIASLKRGSLNVHGNEIWLLVFGKGEKYRKIALEDEQLLNNLWKYFEEMKTTSSPEAPMFYTLSKRGGRPIQAITPETIRRVVEKYSKLAKIEKRVSSHTLRHTFASQLFAQGEDPITVRDLMGHKSLQTTNRYAHTTEERKRAAIKRFTY